MGTVNRGLLLRLAKAGKLVCVQSYHFDDCTGATEGKKTLPVRIVENSEYKEGFISLRESQFKSKSGTAYKLSDEVICLIVHSNLNYEFKIVK